MTKARLVVALSLTILVAGTTGCGLISSDIASVKFNLPPRTYRFDAAQTGVNFPPATLPSVPCTDAAGCCDLVSQLMPGLDCNPVICDEITATCGLTATIETAPQTVDLSQEPALKNHSSQDLDVTISQILYDISENSLTVDLPTIEIFIAPFGTTSASDPAATRFGTVPPTATMKRVTGQRVTLDPLGQQAFAGYIRNYTTPFVFLARTTLVAAGGTPLPMGALSLVVRGQLSVKPSL